MKKIISILCLALSIFVCLSYNMSFADCDYSEAASVAQNLDSCLNGSNLVNPGDGLIESGVKNKIVYWTNQIARLLGLLAVGSIVYGAGLMTLSAGEDEKIKKGKDVVKWAMLGFLGLLLASGLVRIVIEVIFSIAG